MNEEPQLPPILGQSQPKETQAAALHVLTLTPFFPSEADDSAGCFVSEPLEELARVGVMNTVFAIQPFYRRRPHVRQNGLPASWFRYFSLPRGAGLPTAGAFAFARIVSDVRRLHRSRSIDIIHAHGPLPCGHAAMLLEAELGIPYVVSVHGLDAYSTNQVQDRSGQWCRRISQRVYRSSRRVICVSEHVREQVLEGTGRSCRTSVVYNGVNPELFSPQKDVEERQPIVLSVGNLIRVKGHDVVIRAVASLANEFQEISLKIIGDGIERSHLGALATELGMHDRIKFLGRRSRRDVASAMRQCTIFALPSRYEALGCVYLEAMSCAKPVVGCRGQGIAEVIRQGSNGFLVGADNERELTLALAMLLRDENLRANLGRTARETILDRFTLAQQAQTLARIYRECTA